jgi:hypothetical protein
VGRNGSVKAYPHALSFAQHREVGTRLLQVRSEIAAVVDVLRESYGRSDPKTRHAVKLLTAIDALKSLLSKASLSELHAEAPAAVQALYYRPEPRT